MPPPMTRSARVSAPRRLSPKNLASTSATRRLGELRRLQVEDAEVDPAARPAADDAEEEHVDEQQRAIAEVDPVGLVGEGAVVDAQADDQRDAGRARCRRSASRRCRDAPPVRAVDLDEPDQAERHHRRPAWPSRRGSRAGVRTSLLPRMRRAPDSGARCRRLASATVIGAAPAANRDPDSAAPARRLAVSDRQRPAFLLRVIGLDHVLGDGRAEIAVLVVLAEDHAGDLRIVLRGEEDEPAVVAQVRSAAVRRALPSFEITCAVPVLPDTSRPAMRARPPVPLRVDDHPQAVVQRRERLGLERDLLGDRGGAPASSPPCLRPPP